MKTLQEISGGFHAAYNEQERRCDAIKAEAEKMREQAKRYQRIAAQKMGEYYKLYRKAGRECTMGWTNGLLRPLLVEIEERTGWEFDNKDDLVAGHAKFEFLNLEDAVAGISVPFHPGAVKYFAEQGIEVE